MAEERKHTEGPWYADDHDNVRQQASDALVACPQDGGHFTQRLISIRERQANALLIAAAPGLLAALEWAVAQIESTHGGTWQKYDADFAKARAAIKRATEG